ncbi:MAG: hypothetical protein HETSPECPRED_001916 [Heterodermia speciosa]|uniref:Uncharacterized protein n=1 Tax=Heterodermia speciosa TaxID=116794 RepID=A0A8H3J377_9LECA|nr:MAG: hypothetical protein HETSPECPRED_001916 [Heterodermia speciosa]
MPLMRQETLTQIDWVSSPQPGVEEAELDYEQMAEPIPNRITASKPRRRRRKTVLQPASQETLTQMDFLSPFLQERGDIGLGDEDDEEGPSNSKWVASRNRKRRKVIKEEPLARTVQTRSAKRSASFRSTPAVPLEDQGRSKSKTAMAPPSTPKVSRRREIPSSQSPPDTPFSTTSGRSMGTQTRSPLAEKSSSILNAAIPTTKRVVFPVKLEIADTLDSSDEKIPSPTATGPTEEVSQIYLPPSMRLLTQPDLDDLNDEFDVRPPLDPSAGQFSTTKIKREILDSDTESDEDMADENGHAARADLYAEQDTTASSVPTQHLKETQSIPAGPRSSIQAKQEDLEQDVTPRERDDDEPDSKFTTQESILESDRRVIRSLRSNKILTAESVSETANPNPTNSPRTHDLSTSGVNISHDRNIRAASEFSIPDMTFSVAETNSPGLPPSQRSNASTPSRHPASPDSHIECIPNDNSPPAGLATETESQSQQNAWRTFSPPVHLSQIPTSPNHISPDSPSTPAPTNPSQTPPLPLSQATTVDLTQPPLPPPLSSSSPQRIPPTSLNRNRKNHHQPSPPPLSSSPLYSRKTPFDYSCIPSEYKAGWDGKRLTDSQLLPDSLMDDSLVGPPGWGTQGSDGLEYE